MSGYVRASLRIAIYRRDSFRCLYCEARADPLLISPRGTHPELELDHVFPRKYGGDSSPWNLATCCLPCNDLKHKKSLEAFVAKSDLDLEAIKRRLYLARRRRLVRRRKQALVLIKIMELMTEARCPWCPSTCGHCFEALAKARLLGVENAGGESDDHSRSEGLPGEEEGGDQNPAEIGWKGETGHEQHCDPSPPRHVDEDGRPGDFW